MASFVLSFFPLDVLGEIWDLIELVSEGFLTYSRAKVKVTVAIFRTNLVIALAPSFMDRFSVTSQECLI